MNIDYRQFYRGTTNLPSYGNNSYKKDTLVKYEFNTRDENGNKIMDKMSKEETLQVMKEVRSLYGDAVIVEFSGDAMAALVESEKTQKVSLSKKKSNTSNPLYIILQPTQKTAAKKKINLYMVQFEKTFVLPLILFT